MDFIPFNYIPKYGKYSYSVLSSETVLKVGIQSVVQGFAIDLALFMLFRFVKWSGWSGWSPCYSGLSSGNHTAVWMVSVLFRFVKW